MSSRNRRLTPEEQKTAPWLYKTLISGKTLSEMRTVLKEKGFEVEYIEEFSDSDSEWGKRLKKRLLAAVTLGKVRLIDNVER